MKTKQNCFLTTLWVVLLFSVLTTQAAAGTVGMVVDDNTRRTTIFDADNDTILGSVGFAQRFDGDCSITEDQTKGYFTTFRRRLWVVDIPNLAVSKVITIAIESEDTSITPDGKYVVVSNGSAFRPLSIVDTSSDTQIGTANVSGQDHNSVDVCDDGTVLTTSINRGRVYKGSIDASGTLTNSGQSLAASQPNNTTCAPGSKTGVVVRRLNSGFSVLSFKTSNMAIADRLSSGYTLATAFSPDGFTLYLLNRNGTLTAYDYDPDTGAIGNQIFSAAGDSLATFFGMDQLAVHPNGKKVYVSAFGKVNIFDAANGTLLNSITGSSIANPTGICFARAALDTTPPVITTSDIAVEATGPLTPVDIGAVTSATDDVGVVSLTNDNPGPYTVGTHTVNWEACDEAGNCAQAIQTVTVTDTTPPVVTAPADILLELDNDALEDALENLGLDDDVHFVPASLVSLGNATATDAVGVVSITHDAPANFPLGITVVTWSAVDTSGNVGTATQMVRVVEELDDDDEGGDDDDDDEGGDDDDDDEGGDDDDDDD